MPVISALSEDTVYRVAPDAAAVQTARGLVRKKSFQDLGISADGTWLLARCQGSGKEPYSVSVDLADPAVPVGRCTCPSRKFPCKHSLGLMLAYLAAPDDFEECEPPAELLAKREKKVKRGEKTSEEPSAPRKVNRTAQLKKATEQREGLELLEKLVIDLASGGQWYEPARLDRLERQARQMNDHYLPGAAVMLRRLLQCGRTPSSATPAEGGAGGLLDDERSEMGAQIIGALWATVQRGRNYLEGKLAGEETAAEADAVIEEVLGRSWQLAELREKGCFRQDLRLLELAHARRDDHARQERIETSYLLELKEGTIYQGVTYRPYKALNHVAEQPSYAQPLRIAEAAIYPGFTNPRIRWEKSAEQTEPAASHLQEAYALAQPAFDAAVAAFRKQTKNPLSLGAEAVFLLRCATVGRIGNQAIIEDAHGNRLPAGEANEENAGNLFRAAGMLRQPVVLARLVLRYAPTRVGVVPLAALTPEAHLRLGV